jgi:hypothetical protein
MKKHRYIIGGFCLIGLVLFLDGRYRIFSKKTLPSICVPKPPSDLSSGLNWLQFSGLMPEGADVSFATERDELGREFGTILYRARAYKVTLRPQGSGACLDFTPHLPLNQDGPNLQEDLAMLQDVIERFLYERWAAMFVLAAILVGMAWLAKRNRRLAEEAVAQIGPPLVESLPELAQELERLLLAGNEPALAAQIPELRIVDRCRCGDGFCATFYVQPKPEAAYGPGHRNVMLEPETGMLILDVVNERIAAVEVLHRDEIREKVHALLP